MSMSHHHHHHHQEAEGGDRRMVLAIIVNVGLTFAQIVGGIFSGSLSLIADALHNFSDAASLAIAAYARRIARRPSNAAMTFGYVRAEVVAALINYTTLIVIGLYLVYEAVMRFITPEPVEGWIVVGVAVVALVIDLATAFLTYAMSKESMNIRAAFVHNVADALGSVGVIVAGTLILLYDWQIVDPIVTLAIALYILWQAFAEIGGSIRMLMLGTPSGIDVPQLIDRLSGIDGVVDIHHVHVFAIDEQLTAMEAHVVLAASHGAQTELVKARLKALASQEFGIGHSTLEFASGEACCQGEDASIVGHPIRGSSGERHLKTGHLH
ncbi:cation diffusion facilitator family transporter [Pseudorhizobium marinum]|nr:cation diffusion facilitator family transporter [Pseudorhizobium marinum]MBU1313067.1 cation diffusion facilitator family transporter [Alphaproteobacteria bacterium]MBU1551172.1 cation diffusion facilitator family transporter [Alphaproteobacteria bacterium]MBU2334959.1 cation diffusion facilitator family transporter [Alphaproteobacteria bacterium]MBU2388851.1 cation diffusion facilitator family transporter [Alphaproteobacteria bacterium]